MASVDFKSLAQDILKEVGGESNVASVSHCATRLRFQLKDQSKANKAAVESLKGVITTVESGGQFQVVIGNNVPKVYAELGPITQQGGDDSEAPKGNLLNQFVALISSIFLPILWPLAGTGLYKAFLAVAAQFNWIDTKGTTYTILNASADALINFLPLLLAVTASRRFKADTFTSMAIAGALVYPSIVALSSSTDPVTFFGIPVVMVSYVSSVIPVIVGVWVQSHLERFLKKILPDFLRNFMTPLLSVLIMVPLILLTIGPATTFVGRGISSGINWVWTVAPPFGPAIGGLVMGALWQVFVIFGLHWAFVPFMINDLTTIGYSLLIGPLPAAVLAQAAATLGVFIRSKNIDMKELAGPASISGFLAGITEPAIYGVTLRLKKPFIYGVIGGGIGGAIAASGGSAAKSFVFPSLIALPAFTVGNFTLQLIGTAVAIGIALTLTLVLGFDDPPNKVVDAAAEAGEEAPAVAAAAGTTNQVGSPMTGRLVPLSEVPDKVFASGAMGAGVGIIPTDGRVVAPFDGEVIMTMNSHHAFGLRSADGVEVLIHVGLDTVRLKGEHFAPVATKGQKVSAGDVLVDADLDGIKAAGYDPTTVIAVTNTAKFAEVVPGQAGPVSEGDPILTITH